MLVLGAGQSAPYLVAELLRWAPEKDWFVTVADVDEEVARQRIMDHPRGTAIGMDATDLSLLTAEVRKADVVVNFLSPTFQHIVARTCIELGKHMVSASYRDQRVRELDREARRNGCLIVNEVGLDPGIDHMSAMALIHDLKARGLRILKFASYGAGLPAHDVPINPLNYVITWNPRNVVMAGEGGAQYLVDGRIKIVPYHEVFHRTWRFEVPGVGVFEAYPNRDSLSYRSLYGLEDTETMLRATLRQPGWCETWCQIVRLGLPNETLRIPRLFERTWAELVEMFIPRDIAGVHLEQKVATYLGISPTGVILQNLRWLGLFDDRPTGAKGETMAMALVHLLKQKLALPATARDMVILAHEVVTEDDRGAKERVISTMTHFGQTGSFTAMAKTVGLPAAITTKLILDGELPMSGSYIPTHPALYHPILRELEAANIAFQHHVTSLPDGRPIS
ncbi:MAG: saccharopine dehydrogenase [Myxococcales bacterium]|nr:saccharopine dehydrogenase [Myxococcales bacterium]